MKDKIKYKLLSEESALVISWFDVAHVLIFTALLFVILGPLMDSGWWYMHNAFATTDLYTTSDTQTVDNVYNFFRLIPLAALGVVIYYVINYSNLKRDS